MKKILCTIIVLLFISHTQAAQIGLKSGEVIDAKKIHLPEKLEITGPDGKTQMVDTKEIQSIELIKNKTIKPLLKKNSPALTEAEIKNALDEFKDLKPFETPKQTFLTWKEHASKGSIDGMASCYASYRKSDVRKKLKKIRRKERKEMQQSMDLTSFVVADPIYQGKQAYLEVTWTKGLHSESQVLKFILEDQDWKIIE